MDCKMQNKMFYYVLHCHQAVNTYKSSSGFTSNYTEVISTFENRGLSGRVLDTRLRGPGV